MIKASVIVPYYNNAKTILRCVDSIFNTEFDDFEVILVNDASLDGSPQIVQHFTKCHHITNEKNRGVSYSRNQGIKIAKSEILLFTDGDCIVPRDWVVNWILEIELIRSNEPNCVGGCGSMNVWGNYFQKADCFSLFAYNLSGIKANTNCLFTANSFLIKSALLKVGLFDESMRREEDRDLSLRILQSGLILKYIPAISIKHDHCRDSFSSYFAYAFYLGKEVGLGLELKYSKVRKTTYMKWISHPIIYFFFIFPISLVLTLKTFLKNSNNPRVLLYLPFVFLHKLAWRFGSLLWLMNKRKI